ncbi:MAG: septum formation initiator family protein [Lachnospiraceae bacterium]|nr:septum formation initiator family protein [Lachnospiraceae bacterium]
MRVNKTRRAWKRRKRLELRIVILTVLCLLLVASFGKLKLQKKYEAYQQKEEQLLAEIEKEQKRTEEIEELKKYVQTKKYVEEVAKERLGLVYEDEILFKATE